MNEEPKKPVSFNSKEGKSIIYGSDFINRMSEFEAALEEIDNTYKEYFNKLPIGRQKSIKHVDIGYKPKGLKIYTQHLDENIISEISAAYSGLVPYPISLSAELDKHQ